MNQYLNYMLKTAILLLLNLSANSQEQLLLPSEDEIEQAVYIAPEVVAIKAVHSKTLEDWFDINGKQAVTPGNIVRFTISNPRGFLETRPTDQAKVVLYVNGIEMKGITSDWLSQITRDQINAGQVPRFGETAVINIAFKRVEETQTAWRYFYSNSEHAFNNYADLDASIGWEGMSELNKAKAVPPVTVVFFINLVFFAWLALFVIVTGLFVYVAVRTDALRDGGRGNAYSLSLTQLLFWTMLVIGAFIYTLVLTDITSSFNTSILMLLGISAGTTGFAYAIDTNFTSKHPTAPQKTRKGFLKDILSDGTGYSVQRIQVFAWNLVLGLYFILYTLANKSMPEFSAALLFLAGVSSASYLTAKIPENINATRPVGAAGNIQDELK